MKNKISTIGILLAVFLVAFASFKVYAKEGDGNNGEDNNLEVKTTTSTNVPGDDNETEDGMKIQVMNQNQVKLQDQNGVTGTTSVDVKNQNRIQESEKEMNNNNENSNEDSVSNNNEDNDKSNDSEESKKSSERRSEVANAVQTMLQFADKAKGGIGEEVKVIAQNQIQNHDAAEKALESVNTRSSFTKFLIGPKYSEIKNAEKIIEKNQEQIQQLTELKAKLSIAADQQLLDNQISILEKANLNITDSLSTAEKGFSLFGWFSKMFSK